MAANQADQRLAAILAEIDRRSRRDRFAAGGLLSDLQRPAWDDPSRWQAWPWGRRSGKTDLAEKLILKTASGAERVEVYYVSTSIKRAVATIWDELRTINRDCSLGGKPNQTLHTLTFPNESKITVTGVEDKIMADDLRGRKRVALYFVDECQDWRNDLLQYFYDQVIFPSLSDVRGSVILAGTGSSPRGFWHRAADSKEGADSWKRYTGNPFQNPFLPEGEAQALVDKACKDRGCTIDDPSIQREFFAKFIADLTRQIFPFDRERNAWTELPTGGRWRHVVCADVGTVDATSVGAIGWTDADPGKLYLVKRTGVRGLGSSAQVSLIRDYTREFSATLVASVVDPGGGGASLIVDLNAAPDGVYVEGAEKPDKAAACMTMRDALQTGKLLVPASDEELIEDLQTPEWDPDNVGKAIRGHFPDGVDMLLYGFRKARSLNWDRPAAPPSPVLTAAEAMAKRWEAFDERAAQPEDPYG